MTDIVEQLRDLQSGAQWACGATAATLGEAADEIERLRAKLEAVEMELASVTAQITGLEYRGG